GACARNVLLPHRSPHCTTWVNKKEGRMVRSGTPARFKQEGDYPMSTKSKLALALALVLSTSSAVLAAPRHNTGHAQIPAAEQNWFDRATGTPDGAAN